MIPFYFDDPIWILGEDTVPAGTHKLNIVGDIIHIHYQSTGIGTKSKDPDYYT